MASLKVEDWNPSDLIPYEKNPRKNDVAVDRMIEVITAYKFRMPILAKSNGEVIDGHLRLKAALKMGLPSVPVTIADDLSPEQVKAFRLLANKSANWAEWDNDLLKLELTDLQGVGFDLSLTGFDSVDLSAILGAAAAEPRDVEEIPPVPEDPIVRRGEIFILGKHRIMAGDSRDREQVERLLGGVTPSFANLDGPYGVNIVQSYGVGRGKLPPKPNGKVGTSRKVGDPQALGGATRVKVGQYAAVIGDDTIETALAVYAVVAALGVPMIVMWGGNYFAHRLPPSPGWLIWDKENTGNFADVEMAWTNSKRAARLFRHQWNGLIKASERGQKRVHPTQKPVALADWVHQTVAPKATSVIDLFLGSGGVLISAERAGIQCFGMDMSENYIQVVIERWEALVGQSAFHEDGTSWSDLKDQRIAEGEAVG